jgi:hypothetical protein
VALRMVRRCFGIRADLGNGGRSCVAHDLIPPLAQFDTLGKLRQRMRVTGEPLLDFRSGFLFGRLAVQARLLP